MSNVRDLLQARKEEVVAKMAPLYETCTRLRKELVQTEGRIVGLQDELKQVETAMKALDDAAARKKPPTIMEAVVEILRNRQGGMTAREILTELNEKYSDGKIARHSLSPQLSRLKDRDSRLELRGDRWFLLPDEPTLFAPKK
jgi:chromosome segregation ATPase